MEKFGSGIRDKLPGSATLITRVFCRSCKFENTSIISLPYIFVTVMSTYGLFFVMNFHVPCYNVQEMLAEKNPWPGGKSFFRKHGTIKLR
jgi:hypothetical protein